MEGVPATRLSLNRLVHHELSSTQTHRYFVPLKSKQYVRTTLDSSGIGLVLSFSDPEGKTLIQTSCGYEHSVRLDLLAEQVGNYTLTVGACGPDQANGLYFVLVNEIRPAVEVDRDRVAAAGAVVEADRLRADHTIAADRAAVEKYEVALKLWQSAKDKVGEAETLCDIGEMLQARGERPKALALFKQALAVVRGLDQNQFEIETRIVNDIGYLQILMGNSQQGLETCVQALDLSRSRGDRKNEARARSIIGEAYFDLGDLKKALLYQQTALRLAQDLRESRHLAQALLRTGYVRVSLGDILEALNAYQEALNRFRSLQDYHGQAFVLAALGHLHSRTGDKQKALDYYNEATSLLLRMEDPILNAEISAGLGYVYYELGKVSTALSYYEQSQALYRALPDRIGEASTYVVIGTIYHSMGEEQRALDSLNQGATILSNQSNPGWESYIDEQIGAVYESLNEDQKALAQYARALKLSRLGESPRTEVSILNRIGRVQEMQGNKEVASQCYDDALVLARAISDTFAEAATLYNLAHLECGLGHWDEAQKQIEAAVRTIEQLRSNVASQDLRISYFAAVRQSYELAVDILMQLHRRRPTADFDARAFDLSERARARSFLESLKEARSNIKQGANPDLLEKERQLERTLNAKAERHQQLLSGKQMDQAGEVANEISQLTTAYEEVRAQIRSQSPHYAALTQPQPLTLKEIQPVLDDDSVLLEYMLGDERSYVWAVSHWEISTYELPGRAEIERAAREVHSSLVANQPLPDETLEQQQERIAKASEQLPSRIANLGTILLEPVATKLGAKRLLIVPDGALQYIPFQILKTAGNPRPLVVDHEIVNEPSASTLALLLAETKTREPASRSVAVFADPVFEADDPRIASSAKPAANSTMAQTPETELYRATRDVSLSGDGSHIPRLLASREEAEAIMSVTPWWSGFEATGFEASRATVMRPDMGNYRILHFATHGLLNDEHPELSGVVLSLFDEKGQRQDGFLRLHDIYNLKLPVDLVVLSACNTGLGKDVRGEGLIGLTRGFMYAGASSVVASLWKVDDEATAQLMRLFYGYMLRDGLSPAAALRKAQVSMSQQKRWQSPYYWSGFIIQGQYLQPESARGWRLTSLILWGGVTALLVVTVFFVLKRRRRTIL